MTTIEPDKWYRYESPKYADEPWNGKIIVQAWHFENDYWVVQSGEDAAVFYADPSELFELDMTLEEWLASR